MHDPLPQGMPDYLGADALQKQHILHTILGYFHHSCYDLVEPPLCEFADVMGKNLSPQHAQKTFTFTDSLSQQNIALRADITAQITRIVQDRLQTEKRPLRLCYGGEVLRTKASQYRYLRQFTQAGIELIADNAIEYDIEIIQLAIHSLWHLRLPDITLDLAYPSLIFAVIDLLTKDKQPIVREYIIHRKKDHLLALKDPLCDFLVDCLQIQGTLDDILPNMQKVSLPNNQHIQKLWHHMYNTMANIATAMQQYTAQKVAITFDLADIESYANKTGIAFTLYYHAVQHKTWAPLGRGGRYVFGEDNQHGVGFTLYLDTLQNIVHMQGSSNADIKKIYIAPDLSFDDRENLIKQGYILVQDAQLYSTCSYIFKNATIQKIQ